MSGPLDGLISRLEGQAAEADRRAVAADARFAAPPHAAIDAIERAYARGEARAYRNAAAMVADLLRGLAA